MTYVTLGGPSPQIEIVADEPIQDVMVILKPGECAGKPLKLVHLLGIRSVQGA